MTALKEFQKLESIGLWRDSVDAQRREVIVSLGDSSLMISSINEMALSHWSLPAVRRLNGSQMPALYAPDGLTEESLEIEDDQMVAAIEKLRGMIERRRPHPGRLRGLLGLGAGLIVAAGAIFWLPDALMRQTASLIPPATRAQIGDAILAEMTALTGRPCHTSEGQAALDALTAQIFGSEGPPRVVILRAGLPQSLHLPGDLFVLNRSVMEDHESPDVVAGVLLAEDIRRQGTSPIEDVLHRAGLWATLRLLTTGQIEARHLADQAQTLLSRPTPLVTEDASVPLDALLARFAQAGVSSAAYGYALDITGETTLALIEADPMRQGQGAPLISDQSWIALQEICTEG